MLLLWYLNRVTSWRHITALYAACLAGNVTEQLWNFTWPAAMATLHPSLLPVAVLGFFTKVHTLLLLVSLQFNPQSLQISSEF